MYSLSLPHLLATIYRIVTIPESHLPGGQGSADIFLSCVSITLGLDRTEDAGGSRQCPQLCWERLGQV